MNNSSDPGVFARLKSRHMVQWAIAYVAGAWVALQAAELLFDIFDLPAAWLRIMTVVLVFGFFTALILSWFHGKKGSQKVTATEFGLLAAVAVAMTATLLRVDFGGGDVAVDGNPFDGRVFRQITATNEQKSAPSWNPEGSAMAVAIDGGTSHDIWELSRDGGLRQLTDDAADNVQPAWSPDGSTILFVSSRDRGSKVDRSMFYGYSVGGDIWSMPAFGGAARKLVEDGYNPAWSPDSSQFAFDSDRDGNRRIWTSTADASEIRPLSADSSGLAVHLRPDWSPAGDWLVYERQTTNLSTSASLVVVSADGTTSFALTDGSSRDMAPVWAGPDRIIYASDSGGTVDLWTVRVDFANKSRLSPPVQVTVGAGEAFDPALSSSGELAYVTLRRFQNMWRADIDLQAQRITSEPQRVTRASWNDFAASFSSDSKRLAFSSDRGGKTNIWSLDADGELTQVTDSDGEDLEPSWAPDDSKLAYFSNSRGNNDIWIVPLPNGTPVPLTPADVNDQSPYWSPDGMRIGFNSDRNGKGDIWVMDVDGTNAVQLADIGFVGHTALWSPDGEWLLFTSMHSGNRDVWAVRSDGSELRQVTRTETQDAHGLWTPDGTGVLYLTDHQAMYHIPFAGGEPTLILDLDETIDFTNLSPDGKTLTFTREKVESDVWVLQ